MVQESTVICVDNSEWMRNGDFEPNRLHVQKDAANYLLQCKLKANPENAVALLSMAEKVDVLATLTQDNAKLLAKLQQIQPRDDCRFVPSLKVAHLVLKHRQNRIHKTRIVIFVGSPMHFVTEEELVKLAKKLKKEKVAVDVICFGEADSENTDKSTAFINALNGKDGTTSHLVVVPSGSTLMEAIASSPICRGEDGRTIPVVGGAGFDFEGEEDPELAMALRVSLEEQRQRQEQEVRQTDEAQMEVESTPVQPVASDNFEAMNEEQQLEWALRMSMQEHHVGGPSASNETKEKMEAKEEKMEAEDEALGQLMNDPEMLRQLVADLPGVDLNSPIISEAINKTAEQQKKKEEDKKKGNSDKKEDGDSPSACD